MENSLVTPEHMEKTLNTIIEMMDQRGYQVVDSDDDSVTAIDTEGNTIIAMLLGDVGKINIECAKTIMGHMDSNNISHAILVRTDVITPSAKDAFSTMMSMNFEFFYFDELQYNITKHRYVPLHEKLSPEEKNNFKERFGLKIPIIKVTDPVSRFYNFKKGDIIRVYRSDYPVYRIVK